MRMRRVEAMLSARRNSVMKRSRVGNPVKSWGSRTYRMTSRMRRESAMLMDRKPSSRNGPIGRIISRMATNSPIVNKRSPFRNIRDRFDLGRAAAVMGAKGPSRRQILLAIVAVSVYPIDISQDFGDRDVELSRNFATDLGVLKEKAGQRFI